MEKQVMATIVKQNPDQKILKVDPERKEYLICLSDNDTGSRDWDIITGRTELYEYIKNAIEYIDIRESFVLVETCKLSERKSIVAFMRYASQFYEDSFDIDDYIKGDWEEEDCNAVVDNSYEVSNDEKFNMAEFMNSPELSEL